MHRAHTLCAFEPSCDHSGTLCTLRRDDGVGLAAPQVGVNVRLMVYNPTGRRGDKEYVLVNPTILSAGAKSDVAEEGCLSFPRIFADVEVRHNLFCFKMVLLPSDCSVVSVVFPLKGSSANLSTVDGKDDVSFSARLAE